MATVTLSLSEYHEYQKAQDTIKKLKDEAFKLNQQIKDQQTDIVRLQSEVNKLSKDLANKGIETYRIIQTQELCEYDFEIVPNDLRRVVDFMKILPSLSAHYSYYPEQKDGEKFFERYILNLCRIKSSVKRKTLIEGDKQDFSDYKQLNDEVRKIYTSRFKSNYQRLKKEYSILNSENEELKKMIKEFKSIASYSTIITLERNLKNAFTLTKKHNLYEEIVKTLRSKLSNQHTFWSRTNFITDLKCSLEPLIKQLNDPIYKLDKSTSEEIKEIIKSLSDFHNKLINNGEGTSTKKRQRR